MTKGHRDPTADEALRHVGEDDELAERLRRTAQAGMRGINVRGGKALRGR
jgi:hypothetical protein